MAHMMSMVANRMSADGMGSSLDDNSLDLAGVNQSSPMPDHRIAHRRTLQVKKGTPTGHNCTSSNNNNNNNHRHSRNSDQFSNKILSRVDSLRRSSVGSLKLKSSKLNGGKMIKVCVAGRIFHLLTIQSPPPPADGCARKMDLLTQFLSPTIGHDERLEICHGYDNDTKTYHFNGNPGVFESVLDFVLNPEMGLHCPSYLCQSRFTNDIAVWGLEMKDVTPCCQQLTRNDMSAHGSSPSPSSLSPSLSPLASNGVNNAEELNVTHPLHAGGDQVLERAVDDPCPPVVKPNGHTTLPNSPLIGPTQQQNAAPPCAAQPESNGIPHTMREASDDDLHEFDDQCLANQRRKVWFILERPNSSKAGGGFALISIAFVMVSVMSLIVGSMPDCQDERGEPVIELIMIEYICIGWFTFEYLFRFLVCPLKLKFLMSSMELIDLISIFPFYLELLLRLSGVTYESLNNFKGPLLAMRLLRVLRVARIFKLARYSAAMKSCGSLSSPLSRNTVLSASDQQQAMHPFCRSIGKTLKESRREVGMLIIFVGIMIILFSTTVYFLEKEVEGTKFTSIPATFWWCIITITTVGYGDMTPETIGGKLVSSLASIAGVVVLAFPITVIVENFYRYYRNEKKPDVADASYKGGPKRFRRLSDAV